MPIKVHKPKPVNLKKTKDDLLINLVPLQLRYIDHLDLWADHIDNAQSSEELHDALVEHKRMLELTSRVYHVRGIHRNIRRIHRLLKAKFGETIPDNT